MDVWSILALVCGVVGILGSVLPMLAGPPISWVGILLVYISGTKGGADPLTVKALVAWLIVTLIVTVMDYVLPAWFTKVTGGHKAASIGATLGLFVGLFSPVGIILGSIIGAFLGEFIVEKKGVWPSFKAGIGAFFGFITTTGARLIVAGLMCFSIIKHVF